MSAVSNQTLNSLTNDTQDMMVVAWKGVYAKTTPWIINEVEADSDDPSLRISRLG